jgi:hypothetical protein
MVFEKIAQPGAAAGDWLLKTGDWEQINTFFSEKIVYLFSVASRQPSVVSQRGFLKEIYDIAWLRLIF